MPPLGALLELPLTIQLQSESGECYEAIFSSAGASLNTTTIFKGTSDCARRVVAWATLFTVFREL